MTQREDDVGDAAFLQGGGQTGALLRGLDWSRTSLGSPQSWPSALKTAVSLMLGARQPVYIAWGPQLLSFYNDGYLPIVGTKHPDGFGQPFRSLWAEIWNDFRPIVEATMAGQAQHFVDLPIALAGRPDLPVGYFTFSYTPLRGDDGAIAGFYCAATETTETVLFARRLATERERQQLLLQQMPGFAAILHGPDHRYEYFNDAYVAIAGARDYLGRTVRDLFPDLEGQGFFELLDKVYATGEPFVARTMPVRLGHDTRGEVFIDLIYQPIRDEAGAVTGIFVGGYDVTERVTVEQALRVSDERYRTLFENIEAAFCVVEVIFDDCGNPIDHRFIEINPAFERQSGLKDALGRRATEVLPNHEQHWFDIYGRIVRTGESVRFENGSEALGRWFDVHALRVGAPEEHRVAILFTDITDRKNVENKLRSLNEKLELHVADALAEKKLLAEIVEGTDAFVQVADRNFRWLAINRSAASEFERIYGKRPRVGDSMIDLLADKPEHQKAVQAVWARALAGESFTETAEFGDPTRDRRSYEMKYNVLRDPDGAVSAAYQFVYDVTDRMREQERLAAAEEALRQSQKMETIGQLTGGVAHDFNNLLMAIQSNLELLRKYATDDPRMSKLIEGALQGVDRGAALTQRLLAFARRQTLKVEPANISSVIDDIRDLLVRSVGVGVELRFDLPDSLPRALVDTNQVELAILNLVVNARDAMPDGGTITISATRVEVGDDSELPNGEYVRVSVDDTGVGMDEDTLARAIEPFFSTKQLGKGTGLGLSMIHGLAIQLNGALRLDSKVGRGTCAELYLPTTTAVARQVEVADHLPVAATPQRICVLVVDDDPLISMSTVGMLEDLGHEVIEANSGVAALQALRANPHVDVLLTDFAMPGMNGLQLAEAARAERPGIQIMLATGYAEVPGGLPKDMRRLTKPYSQDHLARELAGLFAVGR